MNHLFRYFIKNSFLVNLLSALLILLGVVSLFSMKRDLMPKWPHKAITISATLPHAGPEQMEAFVTFPIEEAISGLEGIESLKSTSRESRTTIYVKVQDSFEDVEGLHSKIETLVFGLRDSLPEKLKNLRVQKNDSRLSWFCSVSAIGLDYRIPEHRVWLKKIVHEIKKIPGISSIRERSPSRGLYIKVDQNKLSQYQIGLLEVQKKIREEFQLFPLGTLEQQGKDINIEIESSLKEMNDLQEIILRGTGSQTFVRLKDIAQVEYRFPKKKRAYYTNGKTSLRLILFKDADADVISLKQEVTDLFLKINKEIPKDIQLKITGDGPAYIERQLKVLVNNGLLGVALVLALLFFFLGGRSSLMTSLGIPLAYLATLCALSLLGLKIDLISIVGMILIIGIIVDDAIIVSEQYTQLLEQGHPPTDAAVLAIKRTIAPVSATILTTIVAFFPLLIANDALSQVLKGIPWVVISALGMSWIESFFILPNHLVHFAPRPQKGRLAMHKRILIPYKKLLRKALSWRYPLILLMLALISASAWLFSKKISTKYHLRIGRENVRILAVLKESQSLKETKSKLVPLFQLIDKIPTSKYTYSTQRLGVARIHGTRFEDYRYASLDIRFSQGHHNLEKNKKEIEKFLKKELEKIDRKDFEILKINRRMDRHEEAKTNMAQIEIEGLQSFNISSLMADFRKHLSPITGLQSLFIDPKLEASKWAFQFDQETISSYGTSAQEVSSQIKGHITPENFFDIYHEGEEINVYTYFQENENLTLKELQEIPIVIREGVVIPLKRFGLWKTLETFSVLHHYDLKKIIHVEASFSESLTSKSAFISKLQEEVKKLSSSYPLLKFNVEDGDEEEVKNKKSISKAVLVSLLLILFVLAITLRSLVQPFLIASTIPFGAVGVIWAFYFHGQKIDVMAFVGVIGMAGVVVNDSLIMMDSINRLSLNKSLPSRENLIEAVASRLRPIILTSLTTLGGVFPMAYGIGGDSGFTKPLSLALGWGLLFATLMTLFILPCMVEVQRDLSSLTGRAFTFFKKRRATGTF